MKALSPGDAATIAAYTRAARLFTRFDLSALPVLKPWEITRMLPFAGSLVKWGRVTVQDLAARFTDPFLRQVFPLIHGYPPLPMAAHLANLAGWHSHSAGWPTSGSLAFSRAIERRFLDLGGEIHYKSRVEKILVEACPGRSGLGRKLIQTLCRRDRRPFVTTIPSSGHRGVRGSDGGFEGEGGRPGSAREKIRSRLILERTCYSAGTGPAESFPPGVLKS